jgi:excisionase family DNA binding protein
MNTKKQGFKTEREVLEYLNISRTTIYKLRKSGRLRAYRIGSTLRYADSDVENFLADLAKSADESVGASK